jgi:hypothetical protein
MLQGKDYNLHDGVIEHSDKFILVLLHSVRSCNRLHGGGFVGLSIYRYIDGRAGWNIKAGNQHVDVGVFHFFQSGRRQLSLFKTGTDADEL